MTDSASHETPLTEGQIYDAIGSDGIARLVHAFYQQIPQDDVLGPMYPRTIFRAQKSD